MKDRKNSKEETSRVYRCHRSGWYRSKGRGLWHFKVQGTAKISMKCPASLYVRVKPDGTIFIPLPRFYNSSKIKIEMDE